MAYLRHLSIRVRLDELLLDKDYEKNVLENIRRCSKLNGNLFKVIFWNENLSEKQCKEFVERNEKLLFEVNTQITKRFEDAWFLVDSERIDKSRSRYRYNGDILQGIVYYIQASNLYKDKVGK